MSKESEPAITPFEVINSLLMGELRPENRKPSEVSGYYFDFIIEPRHYPDGAAVALQWYLQDGTIVIAAPIHAYEWAEHLMKAVGRDTSMLPDVAALLFDTLKTIHISSRDSPQ